LLFEACFPEWVVDGDEEILGPIATAGQMQRAPVTRLPDPQAGILRAVGGGARDHGAEPSFAARLIFAPDTVEKVIAQVETSSNSKSKSKDLVHATTHAATWLHRCGLIAHNFEVAA
jgi:hypothetical protein